MYIGHVDRHHYVVTWVLVILAMAASAGGLFVDGIYRDNAFVVTVLRGNDLVTLFFAMPLMAISYYFISQSLRARIVWQGSLLYLVYNYQFYLYGTAFNVFFLIYALLFIIAGCTLIFSMSRMDAAAFAWQFSAKTPTRLISGFMIFFAGLLGFLWTMISLSFVFTGTIPATITQTGHPTAVVFATDLTILIPMMAIGGLLLWRKKPWGYVIASISMVKATAYGISLIVMSVFTYQTLGIVDSMLGLWIALTLGCLASAGALLLNIDRRALKNPKM